MKAPIKPDYSRKADDYAACRPPYADAAFDDLATVTGMNASWVVADIAAGTGNVTRHLLPRVARVIAIEPEEAMRRHLAKVVAPYPASTTLEATAEATTLPDHSVDLITVGQAVHWFDHPRACREFARILKPDGWVALIWNSFGANPDPDVCRVFGEATCRHFLYPRSIQEDWARFIGGVRSQGQTPNVGDPDYAWFEQQQRAIFDRQAVNGLITVAFTTQLVVGKLRRAG